MVKDYRVLLLYFYLQSHTKQIFFSKSLSPEGSLRPPLGTFGVKFKRKKFHPLPICCR